MKTIQTNSGQIDIQEILMAIKQLKLPDLEGFVSEALIILEKKKSPEFIKKEKELINHIKNGGPSKVFRKRQEELLLKSVQETLTEVEHQEALEMIPISEQWTVERTKLIFELAALWETTVEDTLKKLDVQPSNVVYAQE